MRTNIGMSSSLHVSMNLECLWIAQRVKLSQRLHEAEGNAENKIKLIPFLVNHDQHQN